MYYVKLGMNNPISFTARVAPESEFVRLEFYAPGEETPFLTANKTRVDMHWTLAANAIVRAVTRPKDEYKLLLETKVADPGTPGDDCPGYVVVEEKKKIGDTVFLGPKHYYPKGSFVHLRAKPNPNYRFVKWETGGAILMHENIKSVWPFFPFVDSGQPEKECVVRLLEDTTVTAVFEMVDLAEVTFMDYDPPEDPGDPDVRWEVPTIYWDDPNWEDDAYASEGVPIPGPHYKNQSGVLPGSVPVALIRKSQPRIKVKFAGDSDAGMCGRLRATLNVGTSTLEYEADVTTLETILTPKEGTQTLPDMIMNTTASVRFEISCDNGATYVDLGAAQFEKVFVLYGKPDVVFVFNPDHEFPAYWTCEKIADWVLSSRPTVKRLELLTKGHSEIERKKIGRKVTDLVFDEYSSGGDFGAPTEGALWGLLDPPRELDCYSGKVLVSHALMTIGFDRSWVRWRNVLYECLAYPSTDSEQGSGYSTNCTDQEGPSEMCHDATCSGCTCGICKGLPWEVGVDKHPAHDNQDQNLQYDGEPYDKDVHYGWRLGFDGPSEVENFFKVQNDDGEWYYISVYFPAGPFLGSGTPGDNKDKAGRYAIISKSHAVSEQFWFKGDTVANIDYCFHATALP
jgi:hypothetical protein